MKGFLLALLMQPRPDAGRDRTIALADGAGPYRPSAARHPVDQPAIDGQTFLAVAFVALLAALWLLAVVFAGPSQPAVFLAPAALIVAAPAAVIFGAAALGRPRAIAMLVVVVAFGLSLSFRTREAGETGLDLQNGLKLLVWLLLPVIAFLNGRRILFFLRDPLVALMALYALTAMVSTLWSPTPAYTGASALGMVSYLLLACLAVAVLGEVALLRLLMVTLLLYALLTLASPVLFPALAMMDAAEGPRLQGLSGHPNVLGEQMAVLMTLTVILRRERLIGRPVFLAGLLLGLGILLASESRTYLLAVLLAWGIVAARLRGLLLPGLCGAAMLVAAGMLAMALGHEPVPPELLAVFSRSGSLSELATLTGRTDLWDIAEELIAARPVFGWGYNGTEALFVANAGRGFVGDPVNAHNMHLQSAVSLGLIGSLPAFAVLVLLIARMVAAPDPMRDQFVLVVLIAGFAEVGIFATPTLLTLVFFIFLASGALASSTPDMAVRREATGGPPA